MVVIGAVSQQAQAGPLLKDGDKIAIVSAGASGGGPTLINPVPDGIADFYTFCIEVNETIQLGKTYFVKLDTVAVNGGAGGPSPDPLASETAYLYSKYLDSGGALTPTELAGLQLAMWSIEQEVYLSGSVFKRSDNDQVIGTAAQATAANAFLAEASSYADGSLYGVMVMQLWDSYNAATGAFSGNRQDLLYFVGVPDAVSTLAVLLLGLSAIAVARRRFATGH